MDTPAEIKRARDNKVTWSILAKLNGMSVDAIKRYAKAHGVYDGRVNKSASSVVLKSKCHAIAHREGFANITDAIRYYRDELHWKRNDTAKHFRMSITTYYKYHPKDIKGTVFVKSKAWKSATMNNIRKAHEANRRAR